MAKVNSSVKITDKGISYTSTCIAKKEDGYFSAYLPGFDIYFSADSEDKIISRSKAMTDAFFEYYLKEKGWKSFILQLHKLGYKTRAHQSTMKRLLSKRNATANFKIKEYPSQFEGNPVEFGNAIHA